MLNSKLKLLAAAIMGSALIGCGSTGHLAESVEEYNEARMEQVEDAIDDAPKFFLAPPQSSPDVIYVTGTGMSTSMSLARNKAILDAQSQLADQIDALVSSHTKQRLVDGMGDANIHTDQVIKKLVAEVSTSGYQIEEVEAMAQGYKYRFYVLLGYPVGESNKLASYLNQQRMLNKTLESNDKRFNEMNNEIVQQRKLR
jgi:hypothetical protein